MQGTTNRKAWSNEQDQTIKKLVSIYGIEDWTQISNKLSEEYPSSKRSGKQCRQRWYNHLSPIISKNPWTLGEEDKLFRLHRQQGNKWKDISKDFPGRQILSLHRTDNDLKNHFYSTLRKSLRRLNKSLGEKNSTSQMREIKPSVLSKIMSHIYDGENKCNLLDCLKDVPTLIFQFANIKPNKSGLTLKDDQMRDKVLRIFSLILQFNDQYEKVKTNKKQRASTKKEKIEKLTQNNYQQIDQDESISENDMELSQEENHFSSMLNKVNFERKETVYQNTEESMGYSSASSHFSHLIQYPVEDCHEDYHFMFIPTRGGILDEHDQILGEEFQDPEEPSVINECVFNEIIFGKNILHRCVEHENYCTKIVDELLDQSFK